jgi:hypothetical protein
VLIAAATTAAAETGRDVIEAVIGGTMLTLALTRPQLRWIRDGYRGKRAARLWSERLLTAFSFVMGGYAATALRIALLHQLDAEIDALLRGTAFFLFVYAWLTHFEPFVNEWRLRGGIGAAVLYTSLIPLLVAIGAVIALHTLVNRVYTSEIELLLMTIGCAGFGWLFYRWWKPLDELLDRLITRTPARSTKASRQAARR